MNIVISQPMLFPWVGMFEQIKLADIYVHYEDVQFSKGSFTNRVQVKTSDGFKWLTIPLKDFQIGKRINEYETDSSKNWRNQHLEMLKQSYRKAPFFKEMFEIADVTYSLQTNNLSEILIAGLDTVNKYLGLYDSKQYYLSSKLNITGESSQRVHDIVVHFNATNYITGHGAKNYLKHELFEQDNVDVRYMDYQKIPYPQLHGAFNPYVSILDLIANVGPKAVQYLQPKTVSYKNFIADESGS